jgi:ribosomal protein L11 methyltransferase
VLDVGTGSGILSLVALALGAASARAVDSDPEAVGAARENAARNGAALEADALPVEEVRERYSTVVANIDARTLVELAPAIARTVAPGGRLVLSGILAPPVAPAQLADVKGAYSALVLEEIRTKGEWLAVTFIR